MSCCTLRAFAPLLLLLCQDQAAAAPSSTKACADEPMPVGYFGDEVAFFQEKSMIVTRRSGSVQDARVAQQRSAIAEAMHDSDSGYPPVDHNDTEKWLKSKVILEYSSPTYLLIALPIVLLILHELWVLTGQSPLLSSRNGQNTLLVQLASVAMQTLFYMSATLWLPITLDFAVACGVNVAFSALFIPIAFPAAYIWMSCVLRDDNWNQPLARKLLVYATLAAGLAHMGWAAVLQAGASWAMPERTALWAGQQVAFQAMSFLCGLFIMPMMTIQNMSCPTKEKTFWSIVQTSGRTFSLLLGPSVYSIVQVCLKPANGKDLNPINSMGWMFMVQAAIWCWMALGNSLVYGNFIKVDQMQGEESELEEPSPMDKVAPFHRQEILWKLLLFMLCRDLTATGQEAGTVMVLEVLFGWDTAYTGLAWGGIALGAIFFSLVASVLMKGDNEGVFFVLSMALATAGCVFFFQIQNTGWAFFLVGDFLVYGASCVAMGIAEGWAQQAAMPGTAYNYEMFRSWDMIRDVACRVTGPVAMRALLEYEGRNFYAGAQLILVAFATWTAISIVWTRDQEPVMKRQ